MASFVEDLMTNVLSGEGLDALSQKTGIDTNQIKGIAASALPVLMQGMASNAGQPDKAQGLASALSSHAAKEGSAVEQIAQADTADGAKIVNHLLGDNASEVETQIAQKAGVDQNQVGQLLASLAPMVMSQVGQKAGAAESGGGSDLGSMVNGLLESQGGLQGIVTKVMADKDHDGTPDVLHSLMGLFKK